MWKYLFLVFVLIGCSNSEVVTTTKNLETKNEKYLLLKGANLYSLGKKSEALEIYEEILKINGKNSVALREKAIIEGQLGNIVQAEKDNLTLKNLGYLNFEKRDYGKSSKYLKSVSKDFMNDQDYFILGYIEFLNGNYLNSLKYYEYVEDDEIFNNSLFFDSYLNNLKRVDSLKKDSYLKIENKIKYNKVNTIKLSNFYSLSLETYNDIDKEVVEKLINIYYKNGDKVKEKEALNLIFN